MLYTYILIVYANQKMDKIYIFLSLLAWWRVTIRMLILKSGSVLINFFKNIFWGIFLKLFFVLFSKLLHLPPLRFHCADGY
jgi:hypothetical protein